MLNDLTATTTTKSSTVLAALRQCETTTLSPHKALLGAALPTKTIEMDVFNFEPWFDEPAEQPPSASVDTLPLDPIQLRLTPKSNIETRPAAEALRPLKQQVCPLNYKTQEIAPIEWLPELAAVAEDEQASALVPSVVTSEARRNDVAAASAPIDPYRTIEMSPVRLPDPALPSRAARPKLESLRQTVTIQISDVGHGCDTTDFDVPVVKQAVQSGELTSPSPNADNVTKTSAAAERSSRAEVPANGASRTSLESDLCLASNTEHSVSNSSAATRGPKRLSPSAALARLGLLTKDALCSWWVERPSELWFSGCALRGRLGSWGRIQVRSKCESWPQARHWPELQLRRYLSPRRRLRMTARL